MTNYVEAAHRKYFKSISVDIITVSTRNEYKTIYIYIYTHTHTSHEHISIGYDDTFYEECVSIILYGILCYFMSLYVVLLNLYIALLMMSVYTRNR
jgi:hypothetical protein